MGNVGKAALAILLVELGAALTLGAMSLMGGRLTAPPPRPKLPDLSEVMKSRVDLQANSTQLPCPKVALVIMVVGQSNAANHGAGRHESNPHVLNFYQGKCYAAHDPLLGATGDEGSVWTRLGDLLAKDGRRVVLVPLAVASSRMDEWSPGGIYYDRIRLAKRELADNGLSVDLSLAMQGETEGDGNRDPVAYRRHAVALLRALPGKVFMATSSRCAKPANEAIRRAQSAARIDAGAFEGPDLDRWPKPYRACHLTESALSEVAEDWRQRLDQVI